MADQSSYGLRQRKISGLPLNGTEARNRAHDGDLTPTPTTPKQKFMSLHEFKSKQQSFDIAVDECEEEEIAFDTDDEEPEEKEKLPRRPCTPTPLQDFGVSVQHSEVPMSATEFLKVDAVEQDCFTDVSDAEGEEEE